MGQAKSPSAEGMSQLPSSTVRKVKDFILGRSCQKYTSVIWGWGWGPGLCQPVPTVAERGAWTGKSPGSGRAWPHLDTVLGEREEKLGPRVVAGEELGEEAETIRKWVGTQPSWTLVATRSRGSFSISVPWQSLEPPALSQGELQAAHPTPQFLDCSSAPGTSSGCMCVCVGGGGHAPKPCRRRCDRSAQVQKGGKAQPNKLGNRKGKRAKLRGRRIDK